MDIEDMSFKQASDELEAILRALEGNQLELEESLARYERGVALLRMLQRRLSDAQQTVKVLLGDVDPDLTDIKLDDAAASPVASPAAT
jgi:exodeoxyribonuclease VII small subunit